jgi:hypothetical protein
MRVATPLLHRSVPSVMIAACRGARARWRRRWLQGHPQFARSNGIGGGIATVAAEVLIAENAATARMGCRDLVGKLYPASASMASAMIVRRAKLADTATLRNRRRFAKASLK